MRRPILSLLVLLAFLGLAAAQSFTGKCVGVSDGDTVSVLWEEREFKIRLHGIDAPERGQDFSKQAKKFTSDLVFGKAVTVKVMDIDRYGRIVGRLTVAGRDVSVEIVRAGFAWHYKRYSSEPVFAKAEAEARSARRGLWSMKMPIPPWEWKKRR